MNRFPVLGNKVANRTRFRFLAMIAMDKIEPGVCGCGVADVDDDANGVIDCEESPAPATTDCCGGGLPMVLPVLMLGWRRRKSRFVMPEGKRHAVQI